MIDKLKNFFIVKNRDRELDRSFRSTISSFNRRFSLSNNRIEYNDLKSLYSFLSSGGVSYKRVFENFNNSGLDIAFSCVPVSQIDDFYFSITSIDCLHDRPSHTENTNIYVRTDNKGEKYIEIHIVTIEPNNAYILETRSSMFDYTFKDSISIDGYNQISTCGNRNSNMIIKSLIETIQRIVLAILKTCVRV